MATKRRANAETAKEAWDPRFKEYFEEPISKYSQDMDQFKTKSGKSYHQNWYKKKLNEIAVDVKRLDEYEFVQHLHSQVIHSSFVILAWGPSVPEETCLPDSLVITLRVLSGFAGYFKIPFSEKEREAIDLASVSLY